MKPERLEELSRLVSRLPWNLLDHAEQEACRRIARALYAEVVEECAKEAEEWQVFFKHSGKRASGEIAAAIRAMKGGEG